MDEVQKVGASGAGIPWTHRLINRAVLRPFVEWRTTWDEAEAKFRTNDTAVRMALAGLSPAQLEQRVKVPKLVGLEEGSRFWSVAMTCRHLEVVGAKMLEIITGLSRGEVITERVDFEGVKAVDVPAGAVDAYFRFADGALTTLKAVDRGARGTVPHPWFGELDAKGWLWLAGVHTWAHARQVRAIRAEL